MPAVADILIPLALDTAYSYAVPAGLVLAEGDIVQVPLGPRETIGVVWGLDERASGVRRLTMHCPKTAIRRWKRWLRC